MTTAVAVGMEKHSGTKDCADYIGSDELVGIQPGGQVSRQQRLGLQKRGDRSPARALLATKRGEADQTDSCYGGS